MSNSNIGWRQAGMASLATALVLGASLAGAGSASADLDYNFTRLAGADRYETSAEVALEGWDGDGSDVVLASGEPGHFPDALSANYLAGQLGGPVLLTRAAATPDVVLDALADIGPTDIYIVGGTAVVSAAQETSLEDESGYIVHRVAGADRYATDAAVIDKAEDVGGAGSTAIVTTGADFPDAITAGPMSVWNSMPIALTTATNISDDVVDELVESGVGDFIVLGGPTIVSQAVIDEIEDAGIDFDQRIFGADRAETSTLVADYANDAAGLNWGSNSVDVASGYPFGTGADALSGGPLSGSYPNPILITRSNTEAGASVLTWLNDNSDALTTDGWIYGGTGAISTAVKAALTDAARSTSEPTLVSAIQSGDINNGAGSTTTVQFTFSEDVVAVAVPDYSMFSVESGGVTYTGDSAAFSGKTVTVTFSEGLDDAAPDVTYTAEVEADAVTDGTNGNAAGSDTFTY